jgi:hypothetical protein
MIGGEYTMVEATHSDFEIDPATKQREEGEISSQSTQPRYNQETERAIAQARAMMDGTQPSQQYTSFAALVAAIDAES